MFAYFYCQMKLTGDRRSPLRVVGGFQCCFSRKCDYTSNFLRTGASPVPTVRRRLLRIVRNSLWLSLTRYATPPFPQKSRSARLFGCKRPLDGSLSLPTFADLYIAFSRELSFISDNLTAAASHRPTP